MYTNQQILDSFLVLDGQLEALMVRPDHSLEHDLNLLVGIVWEITLGECFWDFVIDRLGLEVLVHVEIFDIFSSVATMRSLIFSFAVCIQFRFWVRKVTAWGGWEKGSGIGTSKNWFGLGCQVSAIHGEVASTGGHKGGMLDDGGTWSSRCIFDKTLQIEVFGLN